MKQRAWNVLLCGAVVGSAALILRLWREEVDLRTRVASLEDARTASSSKPQNVTAHLTAASPALTSQAAQGEERTWQRVLGEQPVFVLHVFVALWPIMVTGLLLLMNGSEISPSELLGRGDLLLAGVATAMFGFGLLVESRNRTTAALLTANVLLVLVIVQGTAYANLAAAEQIAVKVRPDAVGIISVASFLSSTVAAVSASIIRVLAVSPVSADS